MLYIDKIIDWFVIPLAPIIFAVYLERKGKFLGALKPSEQEEALLKSKDDAAISSYLHSLNANHQREFRKTRHVWEQLNNLSEKRLAEYYLTSLKKLLSVIAHVTGDKVSITRKEAKGNRTTDKIWTAIKNTRTFTPRSYEFCLKIALLYPTLFLLLNWLFSGEIIIGDILFVEGAIWYRRFFTVALLVLAGALFLCFLMRKTGIRLVFLLCSFLVSVIGISSGLIVQGSPVGFSLAIAGAGFGILVGFICTWILHRLITPGIVLVSCLGFTSWISSILFVVGSATLIGINDEAILFIGCISSFVFIYIVTGVLYSDYINPGLKASHWLIFNCLFLPSVILLIIIAFSPSPRLDANLDWIPESSNYKYIIGENIALPLLMPLFFSIVPFINAIADWISLNVTRKLLIGIYEHHNNIVLSILILIVDFVLAIFFIFLVTSLMVLFLAFLNTLAHSQLDGLIIVNFQKIMLNVRSDARWVESMWIHAMIVSTLVPTILHLGCVIYAVILWPISHWRTRNLDNFWTSDTVRLNVFNRIFAAKWISFCFAGLLLYAGFILLYEWWKTPAQLLWQWLDILLGWVDPVYAS